MQILFRAEANLPKIRAKLLFLCIFSRRKQQKIAHGNSAKADRLLKRVANAQLCALSDPKPGDIAAIKAQNPLSWLKNARDDFGERRLSAAVGPSDCSETPALQV